ncbi:YdiU family protein [Colwellia sp. MSW7]|uniref:Protein nucleotidyltransferase YdiU n=1 Tax=Colwellia maritima TaxID=2912588 RepID=A0ABS9X5N0_9GAMM|nr:YdiU family protein [Colwellia maritima]MCI2285538.1 YdiU family protein [Colwellia maritima]
MDEVLKLSNSYIALGEHFFQRALPQKVPAANLLLWNNKLADSLLLTPALQKDDALLAQYFSGNQLPEGTNAIALAYSGHQFGHFNPNLGDGRAHLLGELVDTDGVRRDVQLKGSGQTAFSRRGDGKCALGPALREYIMSEALYSLGVPTSRCLAVVATGELINRGLAKPGAVVTRVAASHIRVGSFQYFAARGDIQSLNKLLDYSIERHFPEINEDENLSEEQRVLCFLERVMDKQITLITQWLRIGFIHGVMNTDNTAICGETIDFGPCAMMGIYHEDAVFSSIDEYGRYAFGSQGKIGQWNMARLADCLLLILTSAHKNKDEENAFNGKTDDADYEQQALKKVELIIHQYPNKFDQAYHNMYAKKLGMNAINGDERTIIDELLTLMQSHNLDYTQTFHFLTQSLSDPSQKEMLDTSLSHWYETWLTHLETLKISTQDAEALMVKNNPVVIPRNHHVEEILERCELFLTTRENETPANKKNMVTELVSEFLHVLRSPYQEIETTKNYQDTPKDDDKYYQTFCGT